MDLPLYCSVSGVTHREPMSAFDPDLTRGTASHASQSDDSASHACALWTTLARPGHALLLEHRDTADRYTPLGDQNLLTNLALAYFHRQASASFRPTQTQDTVAGDAGFAFGL